MIRVALLALVLTGCATAGVPMSPTDARTFAAGWRDAGLSTDCDMSAPRVLVLDDAAAWKECDGHVSCSDLWRRLIIVGRSADRVGIRAHETMHIYSQFCLGFADPDHLFPPVWGRPGGLLERLGG